MFSHPSHHQTLKDTSLTSKTSSKAVSHVLPLELTQVSNKKGLKGMGAIRTVLVLALLCVCRARLQAARGILSIVNQCSHVRASENSCRRHALGRPLRLVGGSGDAESDPAKMMEEGERLFAVAMGRRKGEEETKTTCLKALVRLLMGGNPMDLSAGKKAALLEQAVDMFDSASVKYKLQGQLKQAGSAVMRAAECCKNIRDRSYEAADKTDFQEYIEADLSFRDSAFAQIADKLKEAVVTKSMDIFNKQVRDLNGSATFDRSVSALFTLIKSTLSREGEEGKRLEERLATQDDEDIL
ncbi:hypothetical protein GUITHDRAFT_101683 [Guillardia theta CCMP2712]|uniref:Uncharacterized protein n=1 Tax=Guillardia theta (strain CCMP2712) TaxID=905079 RepID=L1JW08_GUITC|nr:hypothetical protein GUITHDRAFT_101683 [Guillardia theta CCMP2712]EKX52514.1 hypothetical protein GUITHDRAFT_101683 [Guillardia theta CCMP2712]|eukprot:XP_005839494.1 hypothetical protein GUITHDRAFT_101683 [Guillardia theta CCMP2712]